MAKGNQNQSGGRATAGRGGLLRPVWQKAKAVPRCNEGIAAPQNCCGPAYIHDTEANALRHLNEQLCLNGYYSIHHHMVDVL